MRSNRKFLALIVAGLLYLGLSTVTGIYLTDWALHPQRRPLTEAESAGFRQAVLGFNAQLRDVSLTTSDGSRLRGWLVRPQRWNRNAVLLLHGLGDNRLGMTGYAEFLLAHGFAVLLPDARAHGDSGGPLATYGLLERGDVAQWVRFLQAKTGAGCVYGMGESMGAAQLLESLASGADFCAVVAESSFSNFREIAYDRMGQPFHLGPWVGRTFLWPAVEVAFLRARWKYGLNMSDVSPEDSIANTTVPVMLVHGQVDRNIPVRHSRRIHQRDPGTVLWEVPGADHCGAMATDPEQLEQRLMFWFSATHPVLRRTTSSLTPVCSRSHSGFPV